MRSDRCDPRLPANGQKTSPVARQPSSMKKTLKQGKLDSDPDDQRLTIREVSSIYRRTHVSEII
jgi:hypothetical protein